MKTTIDGLGYDALRRYSMPFVTKIIKLNRKKPLKIKRLKRNLVTNLQAGWGLQRSVGTMAEQFT
jgi:hypothetical protein